MERVEATKVIVVIEMTVSVEPSTLITDHNGNTKDFRHLRPGRWISVDVEPDERSGMVAIRIVLIPRPH
jgi:hypothetical protein